MRDFKADITLNEEDSLNDLLALEKSLVTLYATTITESVTKGTRCVIKKHLLKAIEDQISVFFLLTELDYERVEASKEEQKINVRVNFSKAKKELEL
jgi:spore coat protein CotF